MSVYLINLLIVTLSTFIGELHYRYDKKIGGFVRNIYLIIAAGSLICVSGFRFNVGTDYGSYDEIYYLIRVSGETGMKMEVLFNVLLKLLTKITSNSQIVFLVTAFITNILIVMAFKKYSINLTLSMYFYIATFTYYSTMNGLRQYMAAAVLFYGFKHIYERNFIKYLIYIIIAFLIHNSALIMLLVYFLAKNKMDSIENLIVTIGFVFAIIVYQPFVKVISIFTQSTRFDHYISIFQSGNNGANILRIIVAVIPVLIMFIFRSRARKIYGEKVDVVTNMGLLGMFFMALAWRQVFFARMSMYFDFYYLLILPMICNLFDKKTNRFLTLLIMICYFIYSTILLLAGESAILPYYYNLNLF